MAPILYKHDSSPPARAVMMTVEILKLSLEMRDLNPVLREQDTPEFTKKNPMRTVPILEDGDFCIADSHAIILFLVDKYGSQHTSLYPLDKETRATINQRLFFDCGILFPRLRAVMAPTFFGKLTELTKNMKKNIDDAYRTLEGYLSVTEYLAADNMTVADVSVVATVSTLDGIHPINWKRFPKTKQWLCKMSKKDFYKKINEPGNLAMVGVLKSFMENNKSNKSKL